MKEKFIDKVKKIQQENKGKIVLVRSGIFFCGYRKDAVIVNKLINYKPICAQEGICKIGIPVNCFKEVTPRLVETGYSYIVFDYTKETKEIKEIYRIEGEKISEEKQNIDCETCWYGKNRFKSTDI